MATAIGGIVGAVVGSQVGGGSARYATSAIGSLVGGLAGRQFYEQRKRSEDRVGAVRVCDPVPVGTVPAGNGDYSGDRRAYDVTYEYAGRTYVTRTHYDPGERNRVRVDLRPEADGPGEPFPEFEYALAPDDSDERLIAAIDIGREVVDVRFEG